MKIKIKKRVFNEAYYPYLWDNIRYLHFYGSAGSGKSVFVAQRLILESFKKQQGQDVLVVRKVERTLKESVYKLIKNTIYQWKLTDHFDLLKSPAEITNLVSGSKFIFSGLDDPEKIKSIAGIQKIWVEEATELKQNDFLELDRRLRGMKDHQVIFTYNPTDENHWLKKQFHNKTPENAKILKTTYLDNKFVDQEYADTLNRLKEIDENQWHIYALGEWGSQNLTHKFDIGKVSKIITKQPIQIIDNVNIYSLPDKDQVYSMGIDPSSGLGNDWTALTLRGFYPDKQTGKHKVYAQMKAKIGERETARISINLANWFNQTGKVLLVPEINGLGRAVVNYLIDGYNNDLIYKRYITDNTKPYDNLVADFGWQTDGKTRDRMINDLTYLFADDKLEVLSEEEKSEMSTFIYVQSDKDVNKGRYEAQEGANDDLLFSDMMATAGFDYIRQYI